ncbi:MAG: S8 family serine peptidase [Bacteroidales bacterium]|nr:S8 family serine peptidase [Bacteroidales bacterium]
MKKIALLILVFISITTFSQTKIVNHHKLVISHDKPKLKQGEQFFDLDSKTITVKVSEGKELDKKYKVTRINKLGYIDITVPDDENFEKFIQKLEKDKSIELIEYASIGAYIDFFPNDPDRHLQWHLPVINMPQAWDVTTGSSSVVVGVLDSGVDWEHTDLGLGNDLYQNIFLNNGEDVWATVNDPTTGNGIDDDGNGFIDDWKGWNYATNTNDTRTTNYHGTFIAGIISAKTHNGTGISGIAGGDNNTGVRILPYCVGITGPLSSILDDAIIDAVDNGADVIQLSLSVSSSTAIDDAILYATNNGVVVVCASGNNYSSSVSYPASNPNVLTVGAIGTDDMRASFSNYGTNLDLVAPGVDIYSLDLNNGYRTGSGTSFAAPQVSAVIALLLSIDPNLAYSEIVEIICGTTQKLGGYTYSTTTGKPHGTWNEHMGYGVLDAYGAVQTLICPTINFVNQTVTTNTTVNGCNINVQNVNVQNNSKLTIDARNDAIINGPFEVQIGSELEIK